MFGGVFWTLNGSAALLYPNGFCQEPVLAKWLQPPSPAWKNPKKEMNEYHFQFCSFVNTALLFVRELLLIHHGQHHSSSDFFSWHTVQIAFSSLRPRQFLLMLHSKMSCCHTSVSNVMPFDFSIIEFGKTFPTWWFSYTIWPSYLNSSASFLNASLAWMLLWSWSGCAVVLPALMHCCYDSTGASGKVRGRQI